MGASDTNDRTIQILLVDDNELNREMEAAMLEVYGFRVVEAESGMEAVSLVGETDFDMIFLDYLMPEMDGLETAERICAVCKPLGRTPILIALTAEESGEVAEAFRARGCQGHLTKPIDEEKLADVVKKLGGAELQIPSSETGSVASMTAEEAAGFRIRGIDIEAAQAARGKSLAQYMDLLSLYYKDGVKQVQIWQSIPEIEMKEYHIWVHALKSASANIGAMALSEQARAQEMAAKDGDYAQVQKGFPKLMETYRTLLEEIGSRLGEQQVESKEYRVTEPALKEEEMKQRLNQALERLEDFQPEECTKAIEALLRHPLPEEVRTRLHEALDKMGMYQDDEAEDILRGTIDQI